MKEQWLVELILGGGAFAGVVFMSVSLVKNILSRLTALEGLGIALHIKEEEDEIWPMVQNIRDRLIRIEANLPNGELRALLVRFDQVESKLSEIHGEVKGHNHEAEDWKRRIALNENRLDRIEAGGL